MKLLRVFLILSSMVPIFAQAAGNFITTCTGPTSAGSATDQFLNVTVAGYQSYGPAHLFGGWGKGYDGPSQSTGFASAQFGGQITTAIKWNIDNSDGEPAPAAAVVIEGCTVYSSAGDGGSDSFADDGFGDGETHFPSAGTWFSAGTRMTIIYPNPDGSWPSVMATPTGASNDTVSFTAATSCDYTVAVYPLRVSLTGLTPFTPPTDADLRCLVGQQVTATIDAGGSPATDPASLNLTITGVAWNVDQSTYPFSSFITNQTSSSLTLVPPTLNTTARQISFFGARDDARSGTLPDPSHSVAATVTFAAFPASHFAGATVNLASIKYAIDRPNVTFYPTVPPTSSGTSSTAVTMVKYSPLIGKFGLYSSNDPVNDPLGDKGMSFTQQNPGIFRMSGASIDMLPTWGANWEAYAETPTAFHNGSDWGLFNFTQIIYKASVGLNGGTAAILANALDENFPYHVAYHNGPGSLTPEDNISAITRPGLNAWGYWSDAPLVPLPGITAINYSSDFNLFLMYKAPGANSQYVPLAVMFWHAIGSANLLTTDQQGNTIWGIPTDNSGNGTSYPSPFSDWFTFPPIWPSWTSIIKAP